MRPLSTPTATKSVSIFIQCMLKETKFIFTQHQDTFLICIASVILAKYTDYLVIPQFFLENFLPIRSIFIQYYLSVLYF